MTHTSLHTHNVVPPLTEVVLQVDSIVFLGRPAVSKRERDRVEAESFRNLYLELFRYFFPLEEDFDVSFLEAQSETAPESGFEMDNLLDDAPALGTRDVAVKVVEESKSSEGEQ